MRKFTLLSIFVALAAFTFAQQTISLQKNVLLKTKKGQINHNQQKAVIWSNDFSNASDWVAGTGAGASSDTWVIGTGVPSGSYAIPGITSTSAANGFALFDSDVLCSGNQIANLTTASSINLTGYAAVAVSFEEMYRRWYDSTFVFVSTNGTTWTKFQISPNAGYANNDMTPNPTLVTVNISSAIVANPATVWIRFQFYSPSSMGASAGCGYAWMIDDVQIIDALANDIQLTEAWADFNGLGYYGVTPVSQLGPVEFYGIASNNGSATQTNVVFDADVNNGSFFTYPLNNMLTIVSGAYDTLGVSTTLSGTLPETFGARVFLTQDQTDEVPSNNSDSIYFSSDYTTYLRCNNFDVYVTPYSFGTNAPAASGMIYGSPYHFNVNGQIDSVFVYTYKNGGATSLKAVLFDASTGLQVDSSAALVLSPASTIQEHKLALVTPYQVAGGTVLIAGIKMTFTTGVDTVYMLAQGGSFPGDVNQASMCYLQVAATWGWYNVSFVPFVGLITDNPTNVEMISNNGSVAVYPNPTTGKLNIVNAENAIVTVFNMLGQEIVKMNSASSTSTIDISNMAEGSYFVRIQSKDNVITKKINLVK